MIYNEESGFYIVDLHNGYQLKYDPFREHERVFTLLRTTGGRVFDGRIEDVIKYLQGIMKQCDICGRKYFKVKVRDTGKYEPKGTVFNRYWQPIYDIRCEDCEEE